MSNVNTGKISIRQSNFKLEDKIQEFLSSIFHGSLAIVKQDGEAIQFNLNEKYLSKEYLCSGWNMQA